MSAKVTVLLRIIECVLSKRTMTVPGCPCGTTRLPLTAPSSDLCFTFCFRVTGSEDAPAAPEAKATENSMP